MVPADLVLPICNFRKRALLLDTYRGSTIRPLVSKSLREHIRKACVQPRCLPLQGATEKATDAVVFSGCGFVLWGRTGEWGQEGCMTNPWVVCIQTPGARSGGSREDGSGLPE